MWLSDSADLKALESIRISISKIWPKNKTFSAYRQEKIITKHSSKSTLSNDVIVKHDKTIVLPFYSPLWFKIAKILKRRKFKVIFKLVNKIYFPTTNSPIPELHKYGIYKVPCNVCSLFYIGQPKRNLETILSECLRCVSNQEIYKTSIGKHC